MPDTEAAQQVETAAQLSPDLGPHAKERYIQETAFFLSTTHTGPF